MKSPKLCGNSQGQELKGRTYGRRRIPDSDIFINGQLDSGKTRFITETIEMGQFAEAKNKLLIVCEEGEEEYDEKCSKITV